MLILFAFQPHGYVQPVGPQAIMLVQDASRGSFMHPYGTPKPMNVYRAPPSQQQQQPIDQTPAVLPSTLPNSAEELKQVIYLF